MKKIKKMSIVLIILSLLCMSIETTAFANINENNTALHKLWTELSEKQRLNTIEPLPYNVDINDSIKASNFSKYLNLGESLETKYDIRDYIKMNVKNQENTNWCWAFATTSVLESNLAKTRNKYLTFSPKHITYATTAKYSNKGFNKDVTSGANPYLSLAYCVNGSGPVLESKVPFDNNQKELTASEINLKPEIKVNEYTKFSDIYKEYTNGYVSNYTNGLTENNKTTYTDAQVKVARNKIKEYIKKYGAITSLTNISKLENYYQLVDVDKDGKNDQLTYYCNDSTAEADHQITIIGWDDNFSKDNFKIPAKNDGAYLVLTSYGEDFANKGTYYVSYDDALIETYLFGVSETSDVDYDNIYQYDPLGFSYPGTFTSTETQNAVNNIYAANVFETNKKKSYEEYLKEISIYIPKTSDVQVYVNTNNDDKTKIELVASPGILESGYHTVKLSSPLKLSGNKFVVCVRLSSEDGAEVPLELNYKSNGVTTVPTWDTATSEKNQSFVSLNKSMWQDLQDLNYKDTNICLKALTKYQEVKDVKVTSVSLNKNKMTMTVGDKSNLVATINPTNATNKNVKWTTSNSNIVTVTEKGVIEAKKEGTADITVTTEDESKTATCKITVNKKTSTDDDKYKKDDEDGQVKPDKDSSKGEENKKPTTTNTTTTTTTTTKDTTTANKIIPYAGTQILVIAVIAVITISGIIVFIKYKKLNDVK